ncbi:MAG: 2-C-methyl-D-erythritol 2,4-cyclodiphosphate synthase [Pedobacter sp.]|nr:MAG: 2-C-methyl-D-erythritol 2,4-cyclodiphosphate synthase [Pedobacter sp.]
MQWDAFLHQFWKDAEEFAFLIEKMNDNKLTESFVEEKYGTYYRNIDAMICLEAPKINPHIPEIKKVLAATMEIDEDDISVKATTTEHLGFVGKKEGVSAYAVVLVHKYTGDVS